MACALTLPSVSSINACGRDALAAGTIQLVMGAGGYAVCEQADWRVRPVTAEAKAHCPLAIKALSLT